MWSPSNDKRAYQMEWQMVRDVVQSTSRPAADPLSSGNNTQQNLSVGASLRKGRVVDGVAYAHCYKVLFEQNRPSVPCVFAGATSFMPVGARQVNTLVPGSDVWVILHPQQTYGVIIAVEPAWNTDPTLALSDYWHQASRCGLMVDQAHNSLFRLDGNGGIVDWSAGRPADSTLAGEWGAITETGTRVMLDSFMAQLGAGEMCGVTAFYHDALLRVSGYGLQIISAGVEEEHFNDQAEIHIYRGEATYPWEQSGAASPGVDPYRTLTPQEVQIDLPHCAAVEPVHDDQQALHRVVALGGYLGQGGIRQVQLPPRGVDLVRYSTGGGPAVFEEFTSLSGRHVIRSAQGIFLVKQPAIPGFKRKRRIESPDGDTPANYRFGGVSGSGPAHRIASGPVGTPDQTMAGILDTVSYACNWQGVHALHYHANDWFLPEESETDAVSNQSPIDYAALASTQHLGRPPVVTQHVDHRYGDVDYYKNTSVIGMTDDGGVVLSGGNGESITLSGGTITLSAPGDIWCKAGRNVTSWAGFDVILRAKNSVDISATEKAVRVKAETDVQVLAGNGGDIGAVLLESKAMSQYGYRNKTGDDVRAGGIQLKCARGDVAIVAGNIYLRTGGGDTAAGNIYLDAGRGAQDIYTYSRDFIRYVGQVAEDNFGADGVVTAVNAFSATSNYLAAGAIIGGTTYITKGGMVVRGNVAIDQGHIASQLSGQYKGLVGSIEGLSLVQTETNIDKTEQTAASLVKNAAANWKTVFQDYWYGTDQAGNDDTIRAVGFSFRGTSQYRATDFRVYEDRWQQSARLSGGVPATWTESPVHAGSDVTYPYPGKAKWVDEPTYFQQDLTLFDPAIGSSRPRSSGVYDDPKFVDASAVGLDGHYGVII